MKVRKKKARVVGAQKAKGRGMAKAGARHGKDRTLIMFKLVWFSHMKLPFLQVINS